jgi:hypothetical protein
MPVILATQEAKIRRMIVVQSQPRQIVQETLSEKTLHKNRAGGVAQGEAPDFKVQYREKKKKFTLFSTFQTLHSQFNFSTNQQIILILHHR